MEEHAVISYDYCTSAIIRGPDRQQRLLVFRKLQTVIVFRRAV